jgi:glutamine synthetase
MLNAIGSQVFNDQTARNVLDPDVYQALKQSQSTGQPMAKSSRDELARSIAQWAMAKGCTSFAHWFSPVRGAAAEKYDNFIDLNYKTMQPIVDFSGSRLVAGETDGSSFPNGGLRVTHTAAAYTAWDMSSPPFVFKDILYIPSAFISFTGHALDERTPLLRSQEAVNESGTRLLRALGDKRDHRVVSNVGWEQEFFITSHKNYLARPDLLHCGRTLLGCLPSRGQQTELNYFNYVPPRVQAFLRETQQELLDLNVAVNTTHNEVAPGQHELSPIFTLVNVAADQNTISRRVMEDVAAKHDLAVMFHEKPFKGINGSGKHCNWGLNTTSGENLFTAGKTPEEQARFMVMMAAMVRAVDLHGDLLRVSVAHAGNDHRLGAQEAPPAIISLYTGMNMEEHIDSIIAGGALEGYGLRSENQLLPFGTKHVLPLSRPWEDRNRTAPLPFCGNRFEFRAVGSSQNICFPMAVLNTIISDSMKHMAEQLESGKSARDVAADIFKKHRRIIFNGNGYSQEWQDEAAKRGLPNLKNTVEALATFDSPKNRALFAENSVLKPEELASRSEIMYHSYTNQVKMEANCLLDMLKTGVLPAALADLKNTNDAVGKVTTASMSNYIGDKQHKISQLIDHTRTLEVCRVNFACFVLSFDRVSLLKYYWYIRRRSSRCRRWAMMPPRPSTACRV